MVNINRWIFPGGELIGRIFEILHFEIVFL
jgi:hypothetical protein